MIQLLTISDLLSMDNDQLYEVYSVAIKNKDLPIINTVRSVIADRYCISELKKSPLDNPFENHDIARFYSVK